MSRTRPLAEATWIVTGAGSGFGREFARRLAARGKKLALWDRDLNGLDATRAQLGGAPSFAQLVDVTDAAAVSAAAAATREACGPVAHVVHCAGILRVGSASEMAAADYRAMIEVNYLGSVHVALATLPLLRECASPSARATLLFVASVAGLRGFPELAGYCASKHAVVGFAQSLRDELEGGSVDVKVLCPPPGDTPMVRALPKLPPIYKLSKMYSAEEIVSAALDDFGSREFVTLVDAGSKALWRAARVAPSLVDSIVRFIK